MNYLENIPDQIVKNDLRDCYKCSDIDFFNYNHIFYLIGEGNIFYPECYLHSNQEEINLYGGFCVNGLYNKVKYSMPKHKYIFCVEYDYDEEKEEFDTDSWKEMYDYICSRFTYYIMRNIENIEKKV